MTCFHDPTSRSDRAKAVASVAVVHLGLAALLVGGSRVGLSPEPPSTTQLIDIALPDPPPPPPPPSTSEKSAPQREQGAAGKRALRTPVVAPPPTIIIPAATPLPAAPVAGTGAALKEGAANAGTGSGAGGTGNGSGGGGAGGTGTAIGEDARLLSGGLDRRDYRLLRSFDAPEGRAIIAILIGPQGRITQCSIRQSSGDARLDDTLCSILAPRMRWEPARDRNGRALTVGIYYTAVWGRG